MKSALLALAVLASAGFANATPVNARYLRFEGYYSSSTSTTTQIGIYEIEAWSTGLNAAKTSTVTANSSYLSNTNLLKDGNTVSSAYNTSRTDPGPASETVPHWIQMDLGSVKPIDRIKVYLAGNYTVSFGLFLSSDGANWTPVARHDLATGKVESDPSAPVVKILSAGMRAGTTLMDVVYRVTDPDDATVKTRALAFVDGVRSFANVLKPVTFVEGTAAKLGDAIAVNVDHTLTWDVGTDWDIDLGQLKFEVLALDQRGLLPLDWIAIPAAGGHPQTTVSMNSPTNAEVLNALFWQYADGDSGLSLAGGILRGNASNGVFDQIALANGSTLQAYAAPFIFKRMNLDVDDGVVATAARAGLATPQGWHAANRAYAGVSMVYAWGQQSVQTTIPPTLAGEVMTLAGGSNHSLALRKDGTVMSWGSISQPTVPAGLSGVIAIGAGVSHSLALKNDGTVVAWGSGSQATVPSGLSGVIAIAAGASHNLTLKGDGTVVAWGNNQHGQVTGTPNSVSPYVSTASPVTLNGSVLSGVVAIAGGSSHSLALKSDGTVVAWGYNSSGQSAVPSGLGGVIAIAAGGSHSLALKGDGTVVAWGAGSQATVPSGLGGVIAIAAGGSHSLALKGDGTVVAWGSNSSGQTTIPPGLTGVAAIAAGSNHSLAVKAKAP